MNPINVDFLASALCERGVASTLEEFGEWFASRRQAQRITVERIPFKAMKGWNFEASTGNLAHETGRFFKIEGVWVETNYGFKPQWSQPIINQPEIGILGILAKKMGGVLHFLMQAKT
ncbi:MAG TPA: NDP-hexose 2,3-dehydratase family protein, partial [Candidatus Sulfotelmatobacter sp.]|nr:NDP-hexose 2,3-dehydratase family protein [Candidatus Sulfotelmatobacter sp.]